MRQGLRKEVSGRMVYRERGGSAPGVGVGGGPKGAAEYYAVVRILIDCGNGLMRKTGAR